MGFVALYFGSLELVGMGQLGKMRMDEMLRIAMIVEIMDMKERRGNENVNDCKDRDPRRQPAHIREIVM